MSSWGLALLFLVFLSKLSLAFFGVPSQVSVIVFQHGLHPFANLALNFILAVPMAMLWVRHRNKLAELTKPYQAIIFILLMMFFIETLLQYFFVEGSKGIFAWAALASTYCLIVVFGMLIPRFVKPEDTVRFLSTWSLNFVVLSLIIYVLRPDLAFKGGRFIGIFKHIPYMVTVATVGVIFTLPRFQMEKSGLKRLWFAAGIFLSLVALVLTGTRSALASVLMAIVLFLLRTPSRNGTFRFFKYSMSLILTVTVLLFGAKMAEYAGDIATGKKSIGEREAQDGVASRMEEVERGWEYFQTSPWLGRGLLAKFQGTDSVEVTSYNSFKDPHNIFASAGVVGGWFFIFWTGFFLLLLLYMSGKALMGENQAMHIFAIYMLVQIPILIIYHWHLSLGGMADRFYWLVFGYLALVPSIPKSKVMPSTSSSRE